jgi:hypothetical protein
MEIPGISATMRYDDSWQLDAYQKLLSPAE